MFAMLVVTLGATYAAFSDKATYTGSTFSVASADLKLLNDVSLGIEETNLVDTKPGPSFQNIAPSWHQDYLVKLYNNATTPLTVTSYSNYETVNDPDELRQLIYCEIIPWDDVNGNGVVDTDELGTSLGMKTLIKWKTEGVVLGQINMGEAKGYVLRFNTLSNFSETKQGKSAIFDFEFNAVGTN